MFCMYNRMTLNLQCMLHRTSETSPSKVTWIGSEDSKSLHRTNGLDDRRFEKNWFRQAHSSTSERLKVTKRFEIKNIVYSKIRRLLVSLMKLKNKTKPSAENIKFLFLRNKKIICAHNHFRPYNYRRTTLPRYLARVNFFSRARMGNKQFH